MNELDKTSAGAAKKSDSADSPYISDAKATHQRRILAPPPRVLSSHNDKEEVLIHVLDKTFCEKQLTDELVFQMRELFKLPKLRENFLNLIEDDYKGYGIDHRKPDIVVRRCLKVKLPNVIYGNLKELFLEFLAALAREMKDMDKDEIIENIEMLMRLVVYSRLFVIEAPLSKAMRDSAKSANSQTSASTGLNPPPSMKRMISDLDQSHIWQLEDIWLKMAQLRAQWISEGLGSNQPNTASSTPDKSEEPSQPPPVSFDYTGKSYE